MSVPIKRINPRRPYQITAAGLKRITLGATEGLTAPAFISAAGTAKPLRSPSAASFHVLVIAHSDRGVLDEHARQCIAAAAILAQAQTAVVVLVLGALHEDLSEAGADQVVVVPELDYQLYKPDIELACIESMVAALQPVRIYMPDNQLGDGDLGRRYIARHPEKTAACHVVEIDQEHILCYQNGGTLLASTSLPEVVLLAADAVDSALPFTASAIRSTHAAHAATPSLYQDLGVESIAAAEIDLTEADFIVSAGNGVSHVETFASLAKALDAAIGASRVAVDNGYFSRDKQIGATGKTVTASVYIAIGISGAVQHLQGIKECRHVLVINRDAGAPIIQRANLSVIGDAQEIMQQLNRAIDEAKSQDMRVNP